MLLQIFSLKGIEYDGEAVSVNARTTSGEITVLDHHRPLITILSGRLAISGKDGSTKIIAARSGFLEVTSGNRVNALIS